MLYWLINQHEMQPQNSNLTKIWLLILQEIRRKIIIAMTEYKTRFKLRDYQVLAFRELLLQVDAVEVLDQSPHLYAELSELQKQVGI
jgi:hypothetical protein